MRLFCHKTPKYTAADTPYFLLQGLILFVSHCINSNQCKIYFHLTSNKQNTSILVNAIDHRVPQDKSSMAVFWVYRYVGRDKRGSSTARLVRD